MDLNAIVDSVSTAILDADVGIVPVGTRTQQQVANPVTPGCVEVCVPSGVVAYDPNDMTITALAGTTVAELNAVLHEHQQEVALDPRDDRATIGGVFACGLSGLRRLRLGPIRDTVLEVRFVDGRGTLVKGGGPVVKNVTGYDLPRLFVGSLGTLGVLVQLTLRCRPAPAQRTWFRHDGAPTELRRRLFRPSAVVWDGRATSVLLEGYANDIATESGAAQLTHVTADPPTLPAGAHRGRISVEPRRVTAVAARLRDVDDLCYLAEMGVGTLHVATDQPQALVAARQAAVDEGGWMLRECGGPQGFGGFGGEVANSALSQRVRLAFDPQSKLSPGRMDEA